MLRAITIGGRMNFTPGANVELALGRLGLRHGETSIKWTFGVNYKLGRRHPSVDSLGNNLLERTGSLQVDKTPSNLR